MRRTVAAPAALGLVLTISLVVAAGGGGTTRWSSAVTPPEKVAVGPVRGLGAPVSNAARASRATSHTTVPARAAAKHPLVAAVPKQKPAPTDPPKNTSVSAASAAAINEEGALSGTGSATLPVTPRAGWLPYYDPSGVALQHPAAWGVQPGELGPLVVSIDGAGLDNGGFRRNVNVLEQPLTTGVTAADYRRISLKQIADTGGIVDDDRAAVLGRTAGRQVIWHVTKAGTHTAYLSVWAIKGRVAYLVTYASDQHNFATPLLDVRRMIASIVLP